MAGYKTQKALGDVVGVSGKSIRNYERNVYPPPPDKREALRRVLGEFDTEGDPVEVALRQSQLQPWRQAALIAEYQRHLHEQQREATG
jgi:transcriptional regulator with XRE-family HTH domain